MSDLSQTKKYWFYTVSHYIYCHMYLHSPVFVQYTIVLHHCQTCEIKYGKLLLLLRSDIPEEKHKSEITENFMGKRKGVPRNTLKNECFSLLKWACQILPKADECSWPDECLSTVCMSVWQLCSLEIFLIWGPEKMELCSHISSKGSHSPSPSSVKNVLKRVV